MGIKEEYDFTQAPDTIYIALSVPFVQFLILQTRFCLLFPGHDVSRFPHILILCLSPCPHVFEHLDHLPQADHTKCVKNEIFLEILHIRISRWMPFNPRYFRRTCGQANSFGIDFFAKRTGFGVFENYIPSGGIACCLIMLLDYFYVLYIWHYRSGLDQTCWRYSSAVCVVVERKQMWKGVR